MTVTVDSGRLVELCVAAATAAGADDRGARALARATADAERTGHGAVGVAHLFDYLASYREGRIVPGARPEISRPAPACVVADAGHGLAQTAFDDAEPALADAASTTGLGALWINNSYTCGELGYYPRRLAASGLVALACATSPALMSVGGSPAPVLGTNPIAFGVPRPGGEPFVVDQASSRTAYVNVRGAAGSGTPIPEGWAVGPDGAPTTDPDRAVRGALLPFGGHRGGNIALLVEVLATLAGASFSLDAPPFDRGSAPPGVGVFVLAVSPVSGATDRLIAHLRRMHDDHGVRLPAWAPRPASGIELDDDVAARLYTAAGR